MPTFCERSSGLGRVRGPVGEAMLQQWLKGGGLRSAVARLRSGKAFRRKRKSKLAPLLLHEPRPLIHPPAGFGVLWSAKSGSKAITYWFLAQQGLLDKADAYANKPHLFRSEVVRKMEHHNQWLASCDPLSLNWLRIVRNPYFRAVSSYRHALGHGYEDERIEKVIHLSIEERGLSFSEFLDYLLRIDITACNKHHAQQWHPIEEHVALRRVINLDSESLAEGLQAFEGEVGLEPLAPHLLARMLKEWDHDSKRYQNRLETGSGVHAETRFTREEARGTWPSYEAFLSNDARHKIERIYTKDFAAYREFL